MRTDDVTAELAGIRADLSDGAAYPHRVMEIHAPRLLAAVEAVLKLHVMQETPVLCWDHVCDAHRDKRGVAVQPPPRNCPDCRFRDMRVCNYCQCPDDEWPCPTYEAIRAALNGGNDHG